MVIDDRSFSSFSVSITLIISSSPLFFKYNTTQNASPSSISPLKEEKERSSMTSYGFQVKLSSVLGVINKQHISTNQEWIFAVPD
jgi:hypothetical protein